MKDETLDDIEAEINQEESAEVHAEAELVDEAENREKEERRQQCLETGYKIMGFVRGAIEKLEPQLSFGGEQEERAFIDQGAERHADVLELHDEVPEVPEWVKKLTPYVMLGWFYVQTGYGVYQFRQARMQAEEEAKKEQEGEAGGQKSE